MNKPGIYLVGALVAVTTGQSWADNVYFPCKVEWGENGNSAVATNKTNNTYAIGHYFNVHVSAPGFRRTVNLQIQTVWAPGQSMTFFASMIPGDPRGAKCNVISD